LLWSDGKIFHGDCIIVWEWTEFWIEEFSSFSFALQFFDYLSSVRFSFFFFVLFVEDEILFVFAADRSEDVLRIDNEIGEINVFVVGP